LKHVEQVAYNWPYGHVRWEEEVFIEDAQNWDEVLERRRNPHIIVFKYLSIDKQMLEIICGLATEREIEEVKRYEDIRVKE